MKKLLILLTILSSTMVFADGHKSQDKILEDRIENNLNYNFKTLKDGSQTLKVNEYDVDIYDNYVNIEAEVNSNPNNFNFQQALAPIKEEVSKSLGNNPQINVVIEYDKVIGEDEVIFTGDL